MNGRQVRKAKLTVAYDCIDRLRDGQKPLLEVGVWRMPDGRPDEPMTDREKEVMSR